MNKTYKKYRPDLGHLAADLYMPDAHNGRCIIIARGMPGSLSKNILATLVAQHGIAALVLDYYGTFNSRGVLTPSNCVASLLDAKKRLTQASPILDIMSREKIGISVDSIMLAGSSFGGNICLQAASEDAGIERVLLLSPTFFYSHNDDESGIPEDLGGLVTYIQRCLPLTHRLKEEDVWRKFFAGELDRLQDQLVGLANKQILVLRGENDTQIDERAGSAFLKQMNEKGIQVHMETMCIAGATHDHRTLFNSESEQRIVKFLSM